MAINTACRYRNLCDHFFVRFTEVGIPNDEAERNRHQANDCEIEFAPCDMGNRLRAVYFVFILEPVRRELKSPGKQQGKGKADYSGQSRCRKIQPFVDATVRVCPQKHTLAGK